jgi:Na+/proline symporter
MPSVLCNILWRRKLTVSPVVVVIYTAVGGLKATFLTEFLHTTVALILLIYFSLAVLTNEHVGGVYGLYDKVMAAEVYIEGNYAGSLLSAKSRGGMSVPTPSMDSDRSHGTELIYQWRSCSASC